MSGSLALEIKDLCGGWGSTTVIEDLFFTLDVGETVSIIGRNGVGKTTFLELVSGRAQCHSGSISLSGRVITDIPVHQRARLGLGLVPQEREVFSSLTIQEHLAISARPGPWNAAKIYSLFPSLKQRLLSRGNQLSGGEQQMLAIARALVGNPRVLLMDEPSEGLAPVVVEQLVHAIRAVVSDGSLSIVLVEQRSDIALELSSRCLIMDRGRIVHERNSMSLRQDSSELAELIGFE